MSPTIYQLSVSTLMQDADDHLTLSFGEPKFVPDELIAVTPEFAAVIVVCPGLIWITFSVVPIAYGTLAFVGI